MKWNWFIPLTDAQFALLKDGLLGYFRFQLALAIETVSYNKSANTLTVYVSKGTMPANIHEAISVYVNGFSQAIKS
jgi:hypothetical protein